MDAFVVHGGLGTTVEALRMKKPVAVTGILLMDQVRLAARLGAARHPHPRRALAAQATRSWHGP
jgi:UDP:flavonoid glycosyltransferase YjiC (YdhE family)